jgi:hypothetical protein
MRDLKEGFFMRGFKIIPEKEHGMAKGKHGHFWYYEII